MTVTPPDRHADVVRDSVISVLGTGGTIATTSDARGAKVANASVASLVPEAVTVRSRDVFAKDSSSLTCTDLQILRDAIIDEFSAGATGVVITHGTDTMEESAFLADLTCEGKQPIVFTGAQRSADDADPDGPRNLADAITVAMSPAARGLGCVISFAGSVFAASGTRKWQTESLDGFAGPLLGRVANGVFTPLAAPERRPALTPGAIDAFRVDIVALHPGVDRVLIDAAVHAGSRVIVLEALGSGNANTEVVDAVREYSDVVFVVSTRVPLGEVRAVYGGGGGGHDLRDAGAVMCSRLRPGQARILALALLASGADVRTGFADRRA